MRNLVMATGFIATFVFCSSADAQPPKAPPNAIGAATSDNEAFLHLHGALGRLRLRANTSLVVETNQVSAIQDQVDDLQARFSQDGPATSPAYLQSLDFLAVAIDAAATEPDPSLASRDLVAIQADLSVKLATAQASLGGAGKRPTEVKVTVTTRHLGQLVKGYRVKCTPSLFAKGPPLYPFNNPTDPDATRTLPPGLYIFYVTSHGGHIDQANAEISLADRVPTRLFVDVQ